MKIQNILTLNSKEIDVQASIKTWEYGNYREEIPVSEKEKECLLKNIINRFIFDFYNLSERKRENIKRALKVTEYITLDRYEDKLTIYIKLKKRTFSKCKTLMFGKWTNYRTIVEISPQTFLSIIK